MAVESAVLPIDSQVQNIAIRRFGNPHRPNLTHNGLSYLRIDFPAIMLGSTALTFNMPEDRHPITTDLVKIFIDKSEWLTHVGGKSQNAPISMLI